MVTNLGIPHGIPNLFTPQEFYEEFTRRDVQFTVERYESHGDWQRARKGRIGASDAAAVLGISRFKTRDELFREKRGECSEEFKGNDLTRFGQSCEPLIRAMWALEHPEFNVYDPTDCILVSRKREWQTCSLDMVCVERETQNFYVGEIKTAVYSQKWRSDYCPDDYFAQVCHELAVTEFSGAFLVARLRSHDMDISDIGWGKKFFFDATDEFMKKQIGEIVKAEEKFVEDMKRGVLRPALNLCV